jgi:hypothetical protein
MAPEFFISSWIVLRLLFQYLKPQIYWTYCDLSDVLEVAAESGASPAHGSHFDLPTSLGKKHATPRIPCTCRGMHQKR